MLTPPPPRAQVFGPMLYVLCLACMWLFLLILLIAVIYAAYDDIVTREFIAEVCARVRAEQQRALNGTGR